MLLLIASLLTVGGSKIPMRRDSTEGHRVVTNSVRRVRDSLAQNSVADPRSAGFGIDMNSLANEVSAGAQLFVPFCSRLAIVARPMLAGGSISRDLDVGGRVELQLLSPVYDNRVRVYLGVGPQGFYEIRGEEAHSHDISGGWDAGVEVFVNRHFAVHWEMGTSGGDGTSGAGPAFSVGFRAYPW